MRGRYHFIAQSFILSLLFMGSILLARTPDTLSLKNSLTTVQSTEGRLAILDTLAGLYTRNYPVKAARYAHDILSNPDADAFPLIIGDAYLHLGNSEFAQGFYDEAMQAYREALSQYESEDHNSGIAACLHHIGRVEYRFGNYPPAIDYMLQALQIRETMGDSLAVAHTVLWLGIVRAEIGEYPEAEKLYQRALRLSRSKSYKEILEADVLNHMARAARKQQNYPRALELHEASRKLYQERNDRLGMSDYYNNLGSIQRRQKKYKAALDYFFKALVIQQSMNDQEGLADGYNDIGTTYSQMNDPENAIRYLSLGLETARRIGLKDDIRYAYASLATTYEEQGDFEKTTETLKQYNAIKDSLFNLEKSQQIAELEFRHERQRAEEEQRLQKELNDEVLRRNMIIVGAIILFLLAFALFMVYKSRLQSRLNRHLAHKNVTIEQERKRSDDLLLNILPKETADELKSTGKAKTRVYDEVSVLFIDFKGFTKLSEQLTAQELVAELDECFRAFDEIIEQFGLEKIKTIGDAYMCAGGLTKEPTDHAVRTVQAGMAVQKFMKDQAKRRSHLGLPFFEARLGIHVGPVVSGVVGSKKFAYDIWGDTVNVASRMEQSGEVGRVNVSKETFDKVQTHFICKYRGKVHAKNKGEIDMYFVEWEI